MLDVPIRIPAIPMLFPSITDMMRLITVPARDIYLSKENKPEAVTMFNAGMVIVDMYRFSMHTYTIILSSNNPLPKMILINGSISPVRQHAQKLAIKNIINISL